MKVKEALSLVLAEMDALSPSELRKELDKYKDSEMTQTLKEMGEVAGLVMNQYPEFYKQLNDNIKNEPIFTKGSDC